MGSGKPDQMGPKAHFDWPERRKGWILLDVVPSWPGALRWMVWFLCHAEARQHARFEPEPVADVVELYGMGELGEEHRGKMAPHSEGSRLVLHVCFACVPVDQTARHEVVNLLKNDNIGPNWCFFVHNTLPSGWNFNSTPARLHSLC